MRANTYFSPWAAWLCGVVCLTACGEEFESAGDEAADTVETSQPFNGSNHRSITQEAATQEVTKIAELLLSDGNYGDASRLGDTDPDAAKSSPYHFINCTWRDSVATVNLRRELAILHGKAFHMGRIQGDRDEVYRNLGFLIHAVEDFYAHSNWVETHAPGELAAFVGETAPAGWVSAYYGPMEPKLCPPGTPDHSEMAKDSQDRAGYPGSFAEARNDAVGSVRAQLDQFMNALRTSAPDTADETLGELGFLHLSDQGDVSDAVVFPTGKVYFFFEEEYLRYDPTLQRADVGYPNLIERNFLTNWPLTWPRTGVDAATEWNNGKIYLFKGAEYARMDIAQLTIDVGYPKPIAGNWGNWPVTWNSGIEAAVMWNNGKAYFFKGSQYVRVDLATRTVDPGYPAAITSGFPGLWTSGIDGAYLVGDYAYFFQGNAYKRVNASSKTADPGVLLIKDNWPGL